MRDRVPCGACRALVPVTGCRHWRPLVAATAGTDPGLAARKAAAEKARRDAVERVAAFRRMMRLGTSQSC